MKRIFLTSFGTSGLGGPSLDAGADAEISAHLLRFAEQTADFVGVADGWGRVRYLNPAARKRLGIADPTDMTLADVFPLDEFAFYYEVARPHLQRTGAWSGEVRVNVGGEGPLPMYVSTSARVGPGGEINEVVVHAREVPRRASARGDGASEVDDETGLLTQSAFDDRVRRALANVSRHGDPCALVLVDVVGTADTTDTASTIVRSLAGRLARLARATDITGRVGKHRLGLLLGVVRGHGEALRVAQMVYESLVDTPVVTAAGEVAVAVRCGAAVSRTGDEPTDLTERAAAAMSNEPAIRDVEIGGPGAVADGSVSMADFRVGLSHGDVRPYAQPVVDLRSGELIGYRGMTRWHHRPLGTLEASAFIEMIADTPLASQVDLNVARELAAVLALSVGATPLRLYTPVSRRLIADVRTEQYLSEIADAFFLPMSQVCLQIARPLLDRWSPALYDALESLRDAGVALALTGVEHGSDAGALAEQRFDELHISPRLTAAAVGDPDERRAVSVIMRHARERDVLVAAAGVDTEPQFDLLIEAGCELGSGDLYGRAAPASAID
jgi:EAL domain-containing protein (putative c-di-GMP-specific phosphodiesterase class I)/GGDEF domain-containing protein